MLRSVCVALTALACLHLVVVSVSAVKLQPLAEEEYRFLFKSWAQHHTKAYASDAELGARFSAWRANLDVVRHHEADPDRTHSLEMNKFADLTSEEFTAQYLTTLDEIDSFFAPLMSNDRNATETEQIDAPLADSVDWVAAGKSSPVRSQGQCGCCYAFGALASVETGLAISQNRAPTWLSTQQLVDCASQAAYSCNGCYGGDIAGVMRFVQTKGVANDVDYPYVSRVNPVSAQKCLSARSAVRIGGFTNVPSRSETALRAAVSKGVITVNVAATAMQLYKSGILRTSNCAPTPINHSVAAVAYGVENGVAYWNIKNSWDTNWGERGYIRIERIPGDTSAGACGVNTRGMVPTDVKPF